MLPLLCIDEYDLCVNKQEKRAGIILNIYNLALKGIVRLMALNI